jgi:peptidoglycan/xylan/chitin deacetylase (PgdA/CDA1 family)
MRSVIAISSLLALVTIGPAAAGDCPGNPAALGVSRTIVVDPTEHPLLGGHNYRESLPLNDREVVLTFDDGPLPPYTTRVLDDLAAQCVKATFFLVGRMARNFPHIVQRIYDEGHTVANHSQNHPFTFNRMSVERAAVEIEDGFASIRAALGEGRTVAPFFRVPGLLRQESVETYLTSHNVMTWSVDAVADDWHRRITDQEITRRAIARLEERGRGILLLHDIKPATALAVPQLLAELKARGFKIVHVVPAGPGRPKTMTNPAQWSVRHGPPSIWPRVQVASAIDSMPLLGAPSPQSFGVDEPAGPITPTTLAPPTLAPARLTYATLATLVPAAAPTLVPAVLGPVTLVPATDPRGSMSDIPPAPAASLWPARVDATLMWETALLPAPAADNVRYSRVWRQRTAKADFRRPATKKDATAKKDTIAKKDAGAPKAATAIPPRPIPRDLQPPAPRDRPVGHQIQIPAAAAPQPARPPAPAPARPSGLFGMIGNVFN